MIKQGRVSVNGSVIESLGTIIDENNDIVRVDGRVAAIHHRKIYILLYKPRNVITTMIDPYKRTTVAQLVKEVGARVYPVGRLDYDTDGVLLMTNDGELAYRLAHTKYEIRKVYSAIVKGDVSDKKIAEIEKGVELPDGHMASARAQLGDKTPRGTKVVLTLSEGHKREVKHIMEGVGHPVVTLRRIEFAGLRLGNLKPGRWRFLKIEEVRRLYEMVGLEV